MGKTDGSKHKDQGKKRTVENVGIAGAQVETVRRYGSAVKEHFVAYSGEDREAGKVLAKGLKNISKSKLNPEFKEQNIKQQSGFSAEVKTVARENAEKIVNGSKAPRSTRTDDIAKQSDGRGGTVGGKNDQLLDIAEIDRSGIYIEGSGRQLKFVGGDSRGCYDKLLGAKMDKYREADVPIEIPSDFYDDVKVRLAKRTEDLQRQIERAEQGGNLELADRHRAQLAKVEQASKNLRKGKLTNQEAIEARLHPKLSTAKDIAQLSHRAGVEAAKTGAATGGGMSLIRNSVSVIKGDKDPGDAALAVAGDTAFAAGLSYATGFMGSAIKGGMQNAESIYLQELSHTAVPAMIATSILEVGKTLYRLADGQIDGVECLNELGEKGTGIVASTAGATVGQVLIPIPVVGGLIGSMCGYALSSMYYNTLTSSLNEAKLAHEERLQVEAECEGAIQAIREYRLEMELTIRNYFTENISAFNNAFSQMNEVFHTGNVDLFIAGANSITETLGGEVLFRTTDELDALMAGGDTITL